MRKENTSMEKNKTNEQPCMEKRGELNLDCLEKVVGGAGDGNSSNEPKSDTGTNEQGILLPEI